MMVESVTNHRKRVKPKTPSRDIRTPGIFLLPIPIGFSNFVREHDWFKSNGTGFEAEFGMGYPHRLGNR